MKLVKTMCMVMMIANVAHAAESDWSSVDFNAFFEKHREVKLAPGMQCNHTNGLRYTVISVRFDREVVVGKTKTWTTMRSAVNLNKTLLGTWDSYEGTGDDFGYALKNSGRGQIILSKIEQGIQLTEKESMIFVAASSQDYFHGITEERLKDWASYNKWIGPYYSLSNCNYKEKSLAERTKKNAEHKAGHADRVAARVAGTVVKQGERYLNPCFGVKGKPFNSYFAFVLSNGETAKGYQVIRLKEEGKIGTIAKGGNGQPIVVNSIEEFFKESQIDCQKAVQPAPAGQATSAQMGEVAN